MNERFIESRKAIMNAREALKNGKMAEARQWAEHAAELTPQSEDPWLVLAAVVSPRESVDYIRKALEVNPDSPRAKQGMEWAMRKLSETPKDRINSGGVKQATSGIPRAPKGQPQNSSKSGEEKTSKKKNPFLPILLITMGCAVFIFAAWSAVRSPVLASILNASSASQTQQNPPFARVNIPKPTVASVIAQQQVAQAIEPTATSTTEPTVTATQEPQAEIASADPTTTASDVPATEPTIQAVTVATEAPATSSPATATPQPQATNEPGAVVAQIVGDTPTPENVQPTVAPYTAPQVAVGNGEHWIDVNLSQQRVYAYAGDTLMNSFVVSTGTWQTPTVTGKFKIWVKVRSQAMTGPGYYLPDVPYVMYFYKDYGLHGTYWHNNFGTPMSHGCVNLTIPDAEWLYNFSSVGTVVNVHY
jgi:lipoprotein-anchoring transpeptidase ErfK/SrfK